jgi:hypothetical protein
MKTPGVYIVEKNAFPNSVVEVATAVPAFIGHTEKADNRSKPLSFKPWRISSMAEFHQYYGMGPNPRFNIAVKSDPSALADFTALDKDNKTTEYVLEQPAGKDGGSYTLYNAMRHFFQNGGGPCYVVSVGDYTQDIDLEKFNRGIEELLKEQEPTMLVIPEAVLFKQPDCISLQQNMLAHCGDKMRNRVAILDVWGGDKPRNDPGGDPVDTFRNSLGINFLNYAAAYYPWVNTTVVGENELSYENIASADVLQALLRSELGLPEAAPDGANLKVKEQIQAIADITKDWSTLDPKPTADAILANKAMLNKTLGTISPLFNTIMELVRGKLNLMPPSAAMAGIYTMVDNSRGVWKAPGQVDQRHPQLHRRRRAGVGRAHAGRQQPRLALHQRAPHHDHAGGVLPAGGQGAGVRAERGQYLDHHQEHDPELPDQHLEARRAGRRGAGRRLQRALRAGRNDDPGRHPRRHPARHRAGGDGAPGGVHRDHLPAADAEIVTRRGPPRAARPAYRTISY